jgi:hypothetical protein
VGGLPEPSRCAADSDRLSDLLERSQVESAELRSVAVDEPDAPSENGDPDREAPYLYVSDRACGWIDAKNLARIGSCHPDVPGPDREPRDSSAT